MKFDEVSKNFENYSVVNPFKIATDAEIFSILGKIANSGHTDCQKF